MMQPLTQRVTRKVGRSLGLNAVEGAEFKRIAKESSIGGEGRPFQSMTLDQQNEFINEFNQMGADTLAGARLARTNLADTTTSVGVPSTRSAASSMSPDLKATAQMYMGVAEDVVKRKADAGKNIITDAARRMSPDLRPRDVKLREGYLDEAADELATRSGQESSDILSFLKGDVDTVGNLGADDAMMQSFKGVKTGMDEAFSEGNFYTRSAIGDMYNNAADSGGDIFAGLSGAGATKSGNAFFQSLSSQEGAGALGGLLVGAGLGAGAAGLVGGDKGEGAMYGAGATMIGRAGAKVLKGAMGEMETSFMKKTLGSKFATEDLVMQEGKTGGGRDFVRIGNELSIDTPVGNKAYDLTNKAGQDMMERINYSGTTTKSTAQSARSQNLEALKSVDTSDMGTIDKFMVNRINDPNKASIGAQSRTMIASGALLSGMAFSSGRTKDRRSGFNKNRGNRF